MSIHISVQKAKDSRPPLSPTTFTAQIILIQDNKSTCYVDTSATDHNEDQDFNFSSPILEDLGIMYYNKDSIAKILSLSYVDKNAEHQQLGE